MGFEQTSSDTCIYTASGGELFLIAVYVDDIILAERSDKCMKEVKDAIADKFTVKDLGELHHFLGVKHRMKGLDMPYMPGEQRNTSVNVDKVRRERRLVLGKISHDVGQSDGNAMAIIADFQTIKEKIDTMQDEQGQPLKEKVNLLAKTSHIFTDITFTGNKSFLYLLTSSQFTWKKLEIILVDFDNVEANGLRKVLGAEKVGEILRGCHWNCLSALESITQLLGKTGNKDKRRKDNFPPTRKTN
eukprot:gene4208-4769_t